ncbi:MAG: class I SAM-dependent methyltransferase [Chloroflexi bacterium]|nr:class I SAM-dependent methyltransferase [Chloroflexota bacterium]
MSEQQYYENQAFWSEARYQVEREQRRFAACAGLLPPEAATLLDVGAGNGAFLRYLEDQDSPLQLLGLERARTAIEMKVCRADIRAGSADELPFGDRSFDVVAALEVIEHLPFGVYERALRELERVAARYILISVPYRENRQPVICPYCGCAFNPYYHMRRFDDDMLSRLFQQFQPVNRVAVPVPEYVIMPLVRRLRLLLRGNPYPASAICPQCGYARSQDEPQPPAQSRNPPGLARFIPLYERPNWMVVLYRRSQ